LKPEKWIKQRQCWCLPSFQHILKSIFALKINRTEKRKKSIFLKKTIKESRKNKCRYVLQRLINGYTLNDVKLSVMAMEKRILWRHLSSRTLVKKPYNDVTPNGRKGQWFCDNTYNFICISFCDTNRLISHFWRLEN